MLGAIVGDIIGSYYEVLEVNAIKKEIDKKRCYESRVAILDPTTPLFTENCSYTDDSILTIAVASSILGDTDYEESLRLYGTREMSYGVDQYGRSRFGSGFIDWLKEKKEGNSFGNGGAMRISPVAYYFDDLETILKEAKKATIPSHNNEEAIKGAQSVCSAIYLARTNHSKEEIKKYIEDHFNYDLNLDLTDLQKNYRFSSKASNSVPQAIYCFLIANTFEDSIRKAISIGGDSDTIAAITGSISEAFYGIPKEIKNQALSYLTPSYRKIVEAFYEEITIKNALRLVEIDDLAFIQYMRTHCKRLNVPIDPSIYGCFIDRNTNNQIVQVRILVPKIINEQTLLINIHEYTHAYEMYKRIGTSYEGNIEQEENRAREKEQLYLKKSVKN